MSACIEKTSFAPDGKINARVADRWFVVERIQEAPDGKSMVRIDDRWYLAEDLAAA